MIKKKKTNNAPGKDCDMEIRKALPTDALGITKVHVSAYKVSYRGYLPDDYLDTKTLNDKTVEKTAYYLETAECYVVEDKQQIIIIAFAYMADHGNNLTEIKALYVDPLFQKQGVGTKLAEYVTGLKKKAGYTKCAVWTLKFGPSLPFYHKMGFIETQNEKKWHPQEFADIPIIELSKNL